MDGTIKYGDRGFRAGTLQEALIQRGFLSRLTNTGRPNKDNIFGPLTSEALLKFQMEMVRLGLLNSDEATGRTCGPRCFSLLFGGTPATETPDYPEKPEFSALTAAGMNAVFGEFDYSPRRAASTKGETFKVLGRWAQENLTTVYVPQLDGVPFYYPNNPEVCKGRVTLHRLAVPVILRFFEAAEAHGLLPLIKTYDGAYNPRFQRGTHDRLSNHAYGTAIDLNGYANGIGKKPAALGQDGCLLPLVDIASAAGLYWGGFFSGSRIDGMHFEVARL